MTSCAIASASFLLRKKENIGARPWDARRHLNRCLSVPGGSSGETPVTIISAVVFCSNQAKGAQKEWLGAPTPLPKCPHTRKGKISNSGDEIAAGLGREPHRGWWR